MKNILIAGLVTLFFLLLGAYLFIPDKIIFSKVTIIKTKLNIADRFLINENNWIKWFPVDSINNLKPSTAKKIYPYKDYFYSVEKKMMNVAEVSIANNKISLKSLINMISINNDSIAIEWKSNMPPTMNPFKRISYYIKARKLQHNIADILSHLKAFLGKDENIYGIRLHVVISKDSTLVTTNCITKKYPLTTDIYTLIGSLRKYIISQGAKENNFPMLHVNEVNDTTFETMVAIPVNKYLEGNGKIVNKRFVPWKVLTAEVSGGNYTVDEALEQMKIYRNDHQIPAMAIPFASLVTDRSKQPDTLQWITRIYTPVP